MKLSHVLLTALALSGTASAATYTVKAGDTLYSIAKATGVDASTLMKLNRLNSSTINVGQKLTVSGAASASAARATTAAAPAARGGTFVRAAATRYLGIRYVLGGNGNGGIDCSSYTMNVFRQMGINLPRTAAAQWRVGSPVSRRDLRAGDLVFFNTMGRTASHVGIYMGDGMMANANSYKGRTVVEPLFANSYWANRYDGARRVLN
ncbi:peptidoglycan endopeptidase [Deinococcus indicus]|uniref:Peptidoglycan endopeptidase n=1 Tax=Deinococcus indicus TaxID=223556 RepID=A0A246BID1_9DEIO|nr:LysM peptidoglycan-binding domain-containing C40 family peptidase [Deinococcus indicus]OWL95015.1 peptidoglycan endopeptidase [Deinococcus indicus]